MKWTISLVLLAVAASVTLARNDQWRDDWTIWNDTIAHFPRKARAYNELGLHLLGEGKSADALRYLMRSVEINPYQPQVYVNIGLAYERLGEPERARQVYERAIWYNPTDPTAYYNLGVLFYTVLADHDKAFRYFLQARDRNPNEPDVHQFLAVLYEERGDHAGAMQARERHERLKHR